MTTSQENKISDESYRSFFNKLQNFKEIQKSQRQRGLNDFNLLTTVLKYDDEVRLHSRMIGNLIDPNGKHYQDTLFLEKFIKAIGLEEWGLELSNVTIGIEYKDIDIYITDGTKHIIIENKIWAGDQPCQIMKYINIIVEENRSDFNDPKEDCLLDEDLLRVIYLTPRKEKRVPEEHDTKGGYIFFIGNEKAPKQKRLDDCSEKNNTKALVPNGLKNYQARYHKISYETHIINWLEESQKEIRNIINLNEAIHQYIDVVKKVNGNLKGNVMSLQEFMIENESLYDQVGTFIKDLNKLKKETEEVFWNELGEELGGLGFEYYEDKKSIRGYHHDQHHIYVFRIHNLQYKVKNLSPKNKENLLKSPQANLKIFEKDEESLWNYINDKDSKETIDMEHGNDSFWKLGKNDIRETTIKQIVNKVETIIKVLDD